MKKRAGIWTALLLAVVMLAGCGNPADQKDSKAKQKTEAFPVTIDDASNQDVTIKKEPKKIVSLMPSNTEITYALGLGDKVVGVTTNDTYPKEVKKVEKVGDMNVNVEKVISLKPDLVLAHESSMSASADAIKQLKDAGITVLTVNDAQSFSEVYKSIEMIGEAGGAEEKADQLVKSMKSDLKDIQEKAKTISKDEEKSVFIEVSPDPDIYTTGKDTFMNEMLNVIHAKNAAADQTGWVQMTDEAIVKLNPDAIVTTDGVKAKAVEKRDGWSEINAVKHHRVYDVDPDLVTRSGPRLIEGSKNLRKAFTRIRLRNNRYAAYIIGFSFLAVSIILGISCGSLHIPIPAVFRVFWHQGFGGSIGSDDPMYTNIMMNIRLPRVVLAALVGAALSIAGAAFQGLLKNPLADPYTLGVSSGASVGAVVTLFLGLHLPVIGGFTLPVVSVAAALATMAAILFFSRLVHASMSVSTLILTGVITNSFLGAFISLIIALTGDNLLPIVHWLLGSVSMRGWSYVILFLPFFLLGTILLIINGRELNVMTYGEDKAKLLGVSVQQRKMMILIAGSLLTGSAVAVSGTIGFVGLVIPHITRLLWGTDHRHLLPLSALLGAGFLVLADLLSRTIIEPIELPIGIITSLAGAPVFALILIRQHRGRRSL